MGTLVAYRRRVISTFLVAHPWLTTVALVACLVGGPLVAVALLHRRRAALLLGVAAVVPVVVLTLTPASAGPTGIACAAEWSLPTLGRVELVANVVLFIPPTLLLAVAVRRPWLVVLIASAGSALVETAQALLTVLHRACSTNDWATNTLGALVGATIAAAVLYATRGQAPATPSGDAAEARSPARADQG